MKFKLYKNFGALNSVPVFDAFANGVRACGHQNCGRQRRCGGNLVSFMEWSHGRQSTNLQFMC